MREYDLRRFASVTLTLIILNFIVWLFCTYGASGVTEAEKEFNKHVVGLFYGSEAGDPPGAAPENTDRPGGAGEPNDTERPKRSNGTTRPMPTSVATQSSLKGAQPPTRTNVAPRPER